MGGKKNRRSTRKRTKDNVRRKKKQEGEIRVTEDEKGERRRKRTRTRWKNVGEEEEGGRGG